MHFQRYEVIVSLPTTRTVRVEGEKDPVTLEGVDLAAMPVSDRLADPKLQGIYANTPGGRVGLQVFGEGVRQRLAVGKHFTLILREEG